MCHKVSVTAKGPPQTRRSLVTSCPAVGGTAAVVQAMLLRQCSINSLPHYMQQAQPQWSDPFERDGAGGGDPSLIGRHHGLELVQESDHHPQSSCPTT
jgi:hypothetical protein